MNKTRKEVKVFIKDQFVKADSSDKDDFLPKCVKYGTWHYGKMELHELLDFIFGEYIPE